MKIEVSIGEIVDKYTILHIKKEKCTDPVKLKNILNEFNSLSSIVENLEIPQSLIDDLKITNLKLWEIEDTIRVYESKKKFDNEFVELARSVYMINDHRFKIKNQINSITKSLIIEEKILPQY